MVDEQIGEVSDYFAHVGAVAVKLEASLKVGDTIIIKGGENEFKEKVTSMQINRVGVGEAKKGDEVGIKVSGKARKGYKVFKAG